MHLDEHVEVGAPVMSVHAEAPGELTYALNYLNQHTDLMRITASNDEELRA